MKISNNLMISSLLAIAEPGENIIYPVYGSFGKVNKLSTSALNNLYGFLALTDHDRILAAKFNMLGMPYEANAYPMYGLKSVKISKAMLYSIKMLFNIDGTEYKLNFKLSKKVHMTDLKNQAENLEGLLNELQSRNS